MELRGGGGEGGEMCGNYLTNAGGLVEMEMEMEWVGGGEGYRERGGGEPGERGGREREGGVRLKILYRNYYVLLLFVTIFNYLQNVQRATEKAYSCSESLCSIPLLQSV